MQIFIITLEKPIVLKALCLCAFVEITAMDMPAELTALNITPQGALLRWNPPLSIVDNYVLTVTHNQRELSIINFHSLNASSVNLLQVRDSMYAVLVTDDSFTLIFT